MRKLFKHEAAQESTQPIARFALYARVSTLNNQDSEMQHAQEASVLALSC
jgi:hypothetical protein